MSYQETWSNMASTQQLLLGEGAGGAEDSRFYVYLLTNPLKNNEPFYVGKGCGNRAFWHIKQAKRGYKSHKCNTIRQIIAAGCEPNVKFVDQNIDEDTAFDCEKLLIDLIGRAYVGAGPLTNVSKGGEGATGLDRSGENNSNFGKYGLDASFGGKKHSEETKQLMSEKQRGRLVSEETKLKMRKPKSEAGRKAIAEARKVSEYKPTEAQKAKIAQSLKGRESPMKGRKHSDESKAKMSINRKGIAKPKKQCKHCGKDIAVNVFTRFHGDSCKEANV